MSRQKVIDIAKKELGTGEVPHHSNRTKYGAWYGLDGHPWCAMFVSWVFDQAGVRLKVGQTAKGFHHCQSSFNIWRSKNRLTNDPKPGDIVLFAFSRPSWSDHTGIFIKWNNSAKTSFTCIEGNTSTRDNRNGGMVMERVRSRNLVKAFVNPSVFDDLQDAVSSTLKVGSRGSAVAAVQRMLDEIGYPTTADGHFGPLTRGSVVAFQKDNLMLETGEVDEGTLGAIQEVHEMRSIARSKFTSGSFLRYGDTGYAVKLLQESLNKFGANPKLAEDGKFGRLTASALRSFQKSKGLIVDGIAGPQVYGALGLDV
jgi:peptidoglycan hydrolase-like protein with peptidoglycan-binding domain